MGGFRVERKVFWRYDLPKELKAELIRKSDRRETCTITVNLLELLGMVVTTWVMLALVGGRADAQGDPILMRGDNTAESFYDSPPNFSLTKSPVLNSSRP